MSRLVYVIVKSQKIVGPMKINAQRSHRLRGTIKMSHSSPMFNPMLCLGLNITLLDDLELHFLPKNICWIYFKLCVYAIWINIAKLIKLQRIRINIEQMTGV